MQREKIGHFEQLIERAKLQIIPSELPRIDIRVVDQPPHIETGSAAGHRLANASETDNANRLSRQIDSAIFFRWPEPALRFQITIDLRNFSGCGNHQGKGLIGHGLRTVIGCMHHRNAAAGGRLKIDAVDPYAIFYDPAQLVGRRNYPSGNWGVTGKNQIDTYCRRLEGFFRIVRSGLDLTERLKLAEDA